MMKNERFNIDQFMRRDKTKFSKLLRLFSLIFTALGAATIVVNILFAIGTKREVATIVSQNGAVAAIDNLAEAQTHSFVIIFGFVSGAVQMLTGALGAARSGKMERAEVCIYFSIVEMALWCIYAFGLFISEISLKILLTYGVPVLAMGFAAAILYFLFVFRNKNYFPRDDVDRVQHMDPWNN